MEKFIYRSDQTEGNSLSYLNDSEQWVECVTKDRQLFWCQGPKTRLWDIFQSNVQTIVKDHFLESSGKLGVAHSLAHERIAAPFTLPPIFSIDASGKPLLGTGMSRLTAEIMCGTPVKDLVMLCLVSGLELAKLLFDSVKEIKTTAEFEELFDLSGVDYTITWEPNADVGCRFINSIVSHSIYHRNSELSKYFIGVNDERLRFLKRFSANHPEQKILVNVYCNEAHKDFFTKTDNLLDVRFFYQPPHEWCFSYGRLMGEFRYDTTNKEPKLHVWAFDVQEPVNLYMLLMWASAQYYAYYTKNRKLVVFDNSNVTSIKEIPNLIK